MKEEKLQHKCADNNVDDNSKLKEFLARTQSRCKELESEAQKAKEVQEKEVKNLMLKLKEHEEKLNQVVKEKKNMEDKERILLNTFDALKLFDEIKKKKESNEPDPVNCNDEVNVGASTSTYNCDNCNFKSSTERSLEQHNHDKHKGNKNSHKTKKVLIFLVMPVIKFQQV